MTFGYDQYKKGREILALIPEETRRYAATDALESLATLSNLGGTLPRALIDSAASPEAIARMRFALQILEAEVPEVYAKLTKPERTAIAAAKEEPTK